MTSRTHVWLGTVAHVALVACASEESPVESNTTGATKDSVGVGDAGTSYVVAEFDLFFASRERMDAYYRESRRGATKSVVATHHPSGAELVWQRNGNALDIRYCVSSSFPDPTRARDDLREAARAWEKVANVRLRHVASEDTNCTAAQNPAVDFRYIPAPDLDGACAAPPFYPSLAVPLTCPLGAGVLAMNYEAFPRPANPNLDHVGVLRHELGHMLGLRHEHPWDPSGSLCSEWQTYSFLNLSGRQLTSFDAASVMYDAHCGNPNTSFALSDLDGVGARALYGMPAAWYVALGR